MLRLSRAIRRLRDDETGIAMVAVMGLLAVSLLLTVLIATSVVQATAYSSGTRASVQSQAAAEAGIAVARASLLAGTCTNARYISAAGATPRYEAVVQIPSGSAWQTACPTLATPVRILSTGFASAAGVAGVSGGDQSKLEAMLSAALVPTQIIATGPAVYAYTSSGFTASGALLSVDGSKPDVLVKQGNLVCSGASSGATNLVVEGGDLQINGSCTVNGNVWASGRVTVDGGTGVGGSVVGAGVTASVPIGGSIWSSKDVSLGWGSTVGGTISGTSMSFAGPTVQGNIVASGGITSQGANLKAGVSAGGNTTLTGTNVGGSVNVIGNAKVTDGTISGDVNATGTVEQPQGTINGGVTAAKLTVNGVIGKNAVIYGPTTGSWGANIKGDLTTTSATFDGSGAVKGKTTLRATNQTPSVSLGVNPAALPRPAVPTWVDFDYDYSQWTGFAQKVISGTTCGRAELNTAIASFNGAPGVIDARTCTNGISLGSGEDIITIQNDIAIIANKLSLGGSGQIVSASTPKRVWLITPDTVADKKPTCPSGSSFVIDGAFTFGSGSAANTVMMYSPCRIGLTSGNYVRGQIFAGEAGMDGASKLAYVAIGLPGVDLNTGSNAPTSSTEANRVLTSLRNVNG